jgi:hypothetical protein
VRQGFRVRITVLLLEASECGVSVGAFTLKLRQIRFDYPKHANVSSLDITIRRSIN